MELFPFITKCKVYLQKDVESSCAQKWAESPCIVAFPTSLQRVYAEERYNNSIRTLTANGNGLSN
jgi:hypothetical protein